MEKRDWRHSPASDSNVSASEAATYPFCAKAWHLEHVVDCRPSDAAGKLRRAGTAAHLTHGSEFATAYEVTQWRLRAIVGLLAIALMLVVIIILLSEL